MKQRIRFLEDNHIDFCEASLSLALGSCVEAGDFPRAFLGFPSASGALTARLSLKTDTEWPVAISEWSEGQIGATIRTGKVTRWPDEKVPYKEVVSKTIQSVCYPIEIDDQVVAVLLFDVFKGEPTLGASFHHKASAIAKKCGKILSDAHDHLPGLLSEIRHLTELCRKETGSKRGYTALQMPGRAPLMVRVGRDTQIFKELGFDEGLTGEVLRTSERIVLGNVWKHPRYLSSDHSINSEAVFPLICQESTVGVLNMEAAPSDHFVDERISVAQEYANEIAKLAYQYINANANPDSTFAQALGYFSQYALTTGMATEIDDPDALLKKLLSVLKQSVSMLGFSDWHINYFSSNELDEFGISAPQTGTSSQLEDLDKSLTRIFGHSRGRVLFCLEIGAESHLDEILIGRIDFLCRATVSEFRRRISEWSLIGVQNLSIAALNKSITVEQIGLSYLDEMCAFLEADISCGFKKVRFGPNVGSYHPFCFSDGVESALELAPTKLYSSETIEIILSGKVDDRQICISPEPTSRFDNVQISKSLLKSATNLIEVGEIRISEAIILPLREAGELIGFFRFSRLSIGLERRFDLQSLHRAENLYRFINGFSRH